MRIIKAHHFHIPRYYIIVRNQAWHHCRYENVFTMKFGSKGQIPYVELNGEEIPDSNVIIKRSNSTFLLKFNNNLSIGSSFVCHYPSPLGCQAERPFWKEPWSGMHKLGSCHRACCHRLSHVHCSRKKKWFDKKCSSSWMVENIWLNLSLGHCYTLWFSLSPSFKLGNTKPNSYHYNSKERHVTFRPGGAPSGSCWLPL